MTFTTGDFHVTDAATPAIRGVIAGQTDVYQVACDLCGPRYEGPRTVDQDQHIQDVHAHRYLHECHDAYRTGPSIETIRRHRAAVDRDRGRFHR
jgi:hypothetical protein